MSINPVNSTSPAVKALVIGVLVVVLAVPLSMLQGLVRERTALREHAFETVAQGWGGALTIGGPVLVVPTELSATSRTGDVRIESIFLLPLRLDLDVDVQQDEETRYVGLYEVPVFTADVQISGTFDLDAIRRMVAKRYPDRHVLWQQARLRLPLADLRGLRTVRESRFGHGALGLSPATQSPFAGLEAELPLDGEKYGSATDFDFRLRVAGSRELWVHPNGSTTRVDVRSNWPHPSFRGAYLPAGRTITPRGFESTWQVLELNRPYGAVFAATEIEMASVAAATLGVGFHQPVDVYQRGERAIKYALVFIALTFMTIFAWEHIAGLLLHPLQYLLVGLALALFYLLLLALSEHIAFAAAYWIAALAQVTLIGAYLAGALRQRRRADSLPRHRCASSTVSRTCS